MPEAPFNIEAAHRWFAAQCFNDTWTLLDKPDRDAAEDTAMIHCAHASRYHWEQVGDAANLATGEWQVARVYATLGLAAAAERHADASLALCRAHELGAFLTGCAHEVRARAAKAGGDLEAARGRLAEARACVAALNDPEDVEVLTADIEACAAGL
jgi:hypothetical protein